VAVTGAAAMAWSLLLLFSFQTRAGALYGHLGLLTALFMLGLAAGAASMRAAAHFASRALPIAAAAAFGYAVLLALVLPFLGSLAESGTLLTLVAHGGLLLLAGLVTGAVFPAAAATLVGEGQGAGEAAGRLETADHLGAGLAALFGAVVFIPALGLTRSAWLLVALQGLAVIMVRLARPHTVAALHRGSTDSTVSP
jgi:spermidine synthase